VIRRYSPTGLSASRMGRIGSNGSRCTLATRSISFSRWRACRYISSQAPFQSARTRSMSVSVNIPSIGRSRSANAGVCLIQPVSAFSIDVSRASMLTSPLGEEAPSSARAIADTSPRLAGKTSMAKHRSPSGAPKPRTGPSAGELSAPNIRPRCSTFWLAVSSPQTPFLWKPKAVKVAVLNLSRPGHLPLQLDGAHPPRPKRVPGRHLRPTSASCGRVSLGMRGNGRHSGS
jgi:hypothetical protein